MSCEREMGMDKYGYEDRLVLNCFITSDSAMELVLGKTSSPYEEPDWEIDIEDATIYFEDADNNYVSILKNDSGSGYSFPEKIRNNSIYTVRIEYPGLPVIAARDYLPSKIEIVDYEGNIIKNDENETVLDNRFTINAGLARFMAVRHTISEKIVNIHGDTISFLDTAWISPSGKGLKSILPGNAINKILFAELNENTEIRFSFESYDGFAKSDNLIEGVSVFELISCSEQYYDFLKTSLLYSWNKEDKNKSIIFPVSVFSNIENGFGIFCGYEKVVFKVKYR